MKGVLLRLLVPMSHTRSATAMLNERGVEYTFYAGLQTGKYEVIAAGKGEPEKASLLEVARYVQARTSVPVLLAVQACEVMEIPNAESQDH